MTVKPVDIRSVLLVRGAFGEMYEPAWARALNELGVRATVFDAHQFTLPGILGRVERRAIFGLGVWRMRNTLTKMVRDLRPDVTVLYQGHYFDHATVRRLRHHTFVTGYHNDDPFGPKRNMLRYRLLHRALREYDGYHVYRSCNISDALACGVRRVGLLLPYYLPWVDYPRSLTDEERRRFDCDVVFAGHVERDLRVACLAAAVRRGVAVRIYGESRYWQRALPGDIYPRTFPIVKATGEDYRRAVCGARIATCFFSKWNRDQYTRRVFEIPACGVFLLSERTPAMLEFYREGREADYFSSVEEFCDKVTYYLQHENVRGRIARCGRERLLAAGHDVCARMERWLQEIACWRRESGSSNNPSL